MQMWQLGMESKLGMGFQALSRPLYFGESCLYLLHPGSEREVERIFEEQLESVRQGQPNIIVIAQEPLKKLIENEVKCNGHFYVLRWGLESADTLEAHPQWKQNRLAMFFRHVDELPDDETPNWRILDEPKIPEYLLASYAILLSGDEIDEDWMELAQGEADYIWEKEREGREHQRVHLEKGPALISEIRRILEVFAGIS